LTMEVGEAIRGRRSVRQFEARPVAHELLVQLVEAGCWAPMASALQSVKYVVVTDERRLRKLCAAAPGIIGHPPAVVVLCDDVGETERQLGAWVVATTSKMQTGMSAFSIALEAYSLGLGTCMVASFNVEAVKKVLHVPDGVVPLLLVSVGYPAESPTPPPRRIEGSYSFDLYGTEASNG
jgi:nitroreductase